MDPDFHKKVEKRTRRAFEAGLITKLQDMVVEKIVPFSPEVNEKYSESIQRYSRDDPNDIIIRFKNVRLTMTFFFVGLLLASSILLFERKKHQRDREQEEKAKVRTRETGLFTGSQKEGTSKTCEP